MRDPHLAALETTLVAGELVGPARGGRARSTARSATPASLATRRSTTCTSCPLRTDRENDEVVCLHVETNQSHVRIAEAARTRLFRDGRRLELEPELVERPGYVALEFALDVQSRARRSSSRRSSRSSPRATPASSEPGEEACDWVMHLAGDFDDLLERHVVSWRHLWGRTRIELGTDGELARVAAPPPVPPAPDGVEQLGRARRRRSGARACTARPTAVTSSGTSCSSSRSSACASPRRYGRCCSTATAASTRLGAAPGRGLRGRDVPVAEREQWARGDPDHAPQPRVGPLAARRLAPAAPRERGHRVQHLAVLPGHRRPRVPALLRRRDDPRDRPVLGQHRRPTTTRSTATRSRG